MPARYLISDTDEWINDISTASVYYLAMNPQPKDCQGIVKEDLKVLKVL